MKVLYLYRIHNGMPRRGFGINDHYLGIDLCCGAVAQMVERSLSMREVLGSIPSSSIFLFFLLVAQPSQIVALRLNCIHMRLKFHK